MLKRLLLLSAAAALALGCSPGKQAAGTAPLEVSWQMAGNMQGPDNAYYKTVFTLHNTSDKPLDNNWVIYYNQFPRVPLHTDSTALKAEKIVANFYRLYPTEHYRSIAPGDSLQVTILFRGSSSKAIEAPMGMYFVPCDQQGRELAPQKMNPVKVSGFDPATTARRNRNDRYPYPTGQFQYEQDKDLVLDAPLKSLDIIPTVKQGSQSADTVAIDRRIAVSAPAELENEASFLRETLESDYDALLTDSAAYPVALSLDPSASWRNDESYRLSLTPQGARITGASPAGVFYGIQTLRAILGTSSLPLRTPAVEVDDYPDLEYRGMHLDIARNFQTPDAVKRLLDMMAYYKLNVFHFHFNDDESWRLEIPGIPELTSYGARRGHTLDEKDVLHPTYGSGPFADDSTSHGYGQYTREQFIDLLRYATRLHIRVIPEIETPGHARAAIYSMKHRYEKYKDSDMEEAMRYLLHDPQDTSTYTSAQGFHDNVMCVANEGVYRFLEKVVDEIQQMYREAGAPLEGIQTGGDEVPRGSWLGSPACQALIAQGTVASTDDLRDYYTERLKSILDAKGLKFYGWMEIATKKKKVNPKFQKAGFTAYCWDTVGSWGGEEVPYHLANSGVDIVLCNAPNLYFDFAYNKHAQEPGLYWGGWVNERDSYNLLPFDVYRSVRLGLNGQVLDWDKAPYKANGQAKERLSAEGKKHIRGIQGELWSETIKGEAMMQYYIFPKIAGLAERAWDAEPAWARIAARSAREEAYNRALGAYLTKIARHEMPLWEKKGINFRLAAPGVEIKDGLLYITNSVPGTSVHYTTDGSLPTEQSPVWTAPVPVEGTDIQAVTIGLGKKSLPSKYFAAEKTAE